MQHDGDMYGKTGMMLQSANTIMTFPLLKFIIGNSASE